MSTLLQVSVSPHLRDKDSSQSIMRDVLIALLPAVIASYFIFGPRAIVLTLVTVVSAVFFEWLARKLMKRESTIRDLSAAVTGLLLALNLPVTFPLWMAVVGSAIAIIVSKQVFGGIGKNFTNPALTARVILLSAFPAAMTKFQVLGHIVGQGADKAYDLVSQATPLTAVKEGSPLALSYWANFLGQKNGCIGEVSILALMIGVVYLFARRIIRPWIPLSYIVTTLVFVTLCGRDPLFHLLSGGLILGAFFMATDYVTSPYTTKGQIIFGIGCGLMTGLIRIFGGMAEGVSFSILFMNILTPLINQQTIGYPRKVKKAKAAKEA